MSTPNRARGRRRRRRERKRQRVRREYRAYREVVERLYSPLQPPLWLITIRDGIQTVKKAVHGFFDKMQSMGVFRAL